jgi:hypothetical protein
VIRLAAANLAEAHYSENAIMVPSPGIKPVSKRERIGAMLQGKASTSTGMAFERSEGHVETLPQWA